MIKKIIPKRFIFHIICNNCGLINNSEGIDLAWCDDVSILIGCKKCGEMEKVSLTSPSDMYKIDKEKLLKEKQEIEEVLKN